MTAELLAACGLRQDADGRRLLGPLDLSVTEGEPLVVLGPNGSGKTTLLRLLAGVLRPTAGRRTWRGVAFERLGRRRLARHVAYLPQLLPLDIPLTVREFLLLARYPYFHAAPPDDPQHRSAVEDALTTVGLEALAAQGMASLSGGERQRVALASALAQEAELWLLDEPTVHLDPPHRARLLDHLLPLARAQRTVVVATHDLELAERLGGRAVGLRGGRIVFEGGVVGALEPAALSEIYGMDWRGADAAHRPPAAAEER